MAEQADVTGSIRYTVSEADHLAAARLHTRRAYRKRGPMIGLAVVWVIYMAIATMPWTQSWARILIGAAGATVVTALIAAGIVGINALLLPRQVAKLYHQHRQLHQDQGASWDRDAITFNNAHGTVRLAWDDFAKWDEDEATLMLYANDLLFYLLPRRSLSEAARGDIVAALIAHSVPKG